jgi:hypothetical protein
LALLVDEICGYLLLAMEIVAVANSDEYENY